MEAKGWPFNFSLLFPSIVHSFDNARHVHFQFFSIVSWLGNRWVHGRERYNFQFFSIVSPSRLEHLCNIFSHFFQFFSIVSPPSSNTITIEEVHTFNFSLLFHLRPNHDIIAHGNNLSIFLYCFILNTIKLFLPAYSVIFQFFSIVSSHLPLCRGVFQLFSFNFSLLFQGNPLVRRHIASYYPFNFSLLFRDIGKFATQVWISDFQFFSIVSTMEKPPMTFTSTVLSIFLYCFSTTTWVLCCWGVGVFQFFSIVSCRKA